MSSPCFVLSCLNEIKWFR
uniref:Uncharacterized protein n=1 Tax=Rhizophora mucronata TaxID=61149 RepID=A0A2P2NX93_RHIMU